MGPNGRALCDAHTDAEVSAHAEIAAWSHKLKPIIPTGYEWRGDCHLCAREVSGRSNMTLKIEKYSAGDSTTIRLIGRMQAEHLEELEKQIRESGPAPILDLDEVTLVDVEIVRFLGTCEARGATLLNCSPYIRDWIGKERA